MSKEDAYTNFYPELNISKIETYDPEEPEIVEEPKEPEYPNEVKEYPKKPIESEKSNWVSFVLIFVIGIFIGAVSFGVFIFSGGTDAFMTDGQYLEQTTISYNQGISDVANYTTITGNFTYIKNDIVRTENILDFCTKLNINGGK